MEKTTLTRFLNAMTKNMVRKEGDYEFSSATNYADSDNPLDVFVVFME